MSNGIPLGLIDGTISRIDGVKALFDSNLSAREACQRFLQSCYRKQPKKHVTLDCIHAAIFAPTGVGKGVSMVIPFQLSCDESCVVVDFKGENYKITADARRAMGHRVVRLDPFGVCGPGSDTFNPLEFIEDSPTAIDECRDLATALVVRTGQEKEPHWADSAEAWIAAMMTEVIAFGGEKDKNLQSVRSLLTNPAKMQAAIEMACASDMWEGMLSRLAHQLTQFKDKELSSTLTTTNRFMRFLDTIAVFESTKKSSFNPADLLGSKMTVYLILPPEHMRAQAALLRLWIGSMLRAVVKGGLSDRKVHFVLDEAASLGHMEILDDAVDKFRGYGVRLQLYYQSLGQLKLCWPDGRDQTLLSNVSQVFFGVNDHQTAEYVSNRLGEYTQVVSSGGSNTGGSSQETSGQSPSSSHGRSFGSNSNWQQAGRKLLKPEEVTNNLDPRVAITFTPGVPPIATWLTRYYEPSVSQRMGFFRMCIDTFCLFVTVAILAVGFTAFINK